MNTLSRYVVYLICDYLSVKDILSLTQAYTLMSNNIMRHIKSYNLNHIYHKIEVSEFKNIVMKSFIYHHEKKQIKKLCLNSTTSIEIINLHFSQLTHLKFNCDFIGNISELRLFHLTHLTLDPTFNETINNLSLENLTHLTFGNDFDSEIANLICPKLTHLSFGHTFNQEIGHLNLRKLTHLTFGHMFNQQLDFEYHLNDEKKYIFICPNLKHLQFGENFNGSLDLTLRQATNLRTLILSADYDQIIHHEYLPKKLKIQIGNDSYINT